MKEIQLSKNGKKYKGMYVAIVDDEDYDFLMQWSWFVVKLGSQYYAARHSLISDGMNRKNILMHHVITGTDTNQMVDHIDRNGLHNCRSNLRNCTKSQNCINRKSSGTSKYHGVQKRQGKTKYITTHGDVHIFFYPRWSISITLENGKRYVKHFKTEIEAAIEYDKKAKEIYGEFAHLNFPD